ncbi:hypothetical protein EJ02DRAFT_348776 [Clathrospora elynae]|uniref:F-box domain-containing protein n=1 Tax=Clathrospora elynae TaxID=706981 RepID=A0A6A5SK51_9PLEO|nr:hypothetical protein EJ02DRAFT_348776 [Clathrospora elynae]
MCGAAESGILHLVDELLLNIIDHIDAHDTLCNLATTCMRFQGLTEPYIWRKLLVIKGEHARRIATAFDSREERIEYIHDLSIRYQDDYRDGIENLNHFMGLMSKLRHLTIETPCPNNDEWRSGVYFDGHSRIDYTNLLASAVYPRIGISLALPTLQSLTLHGHGSGDNKFTLGRAVAMFKHPTLRKIVLSCLNLDARISAEFDISEQELRSTPLQSLKLIECNVGVPFLDAVLSLPKALKELSIGERLHTFEGCEPSRDPKQRSSSATFLTALQKQKDSLQRLTHCGGHVAWLTPRENDPEGSTKLRSFVNLEHLELGLESHVYYYLRQNGFPPALKTLEMLDTAISINAGHDLRSLSDIAFRSLTSLVTDHLPAALSPDFTLHLKFSEHSFIITQLFNLADPAEQSELLSVLFFDRPATYKIANTMKSYNSRFLVSREMFPLGKSYIPPYMYGEDLPVEALMYDSADFWRFNGVNYQLHDDEDFRDALGKSDKLMVCLECRERGHGVDTCLNLGDGSPCLPCRNASLQECTWERDENGQLVFLEDQKIE